MAFQDFKATVPKLGFEAPRVVVTSSQRRIKGHFNFVKKTQRHYWLFIVKTTDSKQFNISTIRVFSSCYEKSKRHEKTNE